MSDQAKLRNILQNNWTVMFKSVKITKVKKRPKISSRLKENENKCTFDSELDAFALLLGQMLTLEWSVKIRW